MVHVVATHADDLGREYGSEQLDDVERHHCLGRLPGDEWRPLMNSNPLCFDDAIGDLVSRKSNANDLHRRNSLRDKPMRYAGIAATSPRNRA